MYICSFHFLLLTLHHQQQHFHQVKYFMYEMEEGDNDVRLKGRGTPFSMNE